MSGAWLHIDDEERRRRRRRRRLLRGLAVASGLVLVAVVGLSLAPSLSSHSTASSRAAAIAAAERAGLAAGGGQLTNLTAAPTLGPAEVTLQILKPEIAPPVTWSPVDAPPTKLGPVAIGTSARPTAATPAAPIEMLVSPIDVASLRAKLEAPGRLVAPPAPPLLAELGRIADTPLPKAVPEKFGAGPLRAAVPGAVARPLVRGEPVITIIIDDLGNNMAVTRRVIGLPAPLTLSFLPDGSGLGSLTLEALKAGHEPFLHLPMEPVGSEDPGPNALLSRQSDEELEAKILAALGRVPHVQGANNHMGSKLTADARAMRAVIATLGRHNLSFVDSVTTPTTIAGHMALEAGLGVTARDVFLDNDPSLAAVRAQLDKTERLARRTGSALAIGHPYPTTLQALEEFLAEARGRGIRFASATQLMALRGCAQGSQGTCSIRTIPEALLANRACTTTENC